MHFQTIIYIFGIASIFILPQAVNGCSGGEVVRKVGVLAGEGKEKQKEYHSDHIDFIEVIKFVILIFSFFLVCHLKSLKHRKTLKYSYNIVWVSILSLPQRPSASIGQ